MGPERSNARSIHARLAVLNAGLATLISLVAIGFSPPTAAALSIAATVGAVEIGCRLTAPSPAPKTRSTIVVVILILIVQVLAIGYPPVATLALILGTAFVITEIARRLTDLPYRLPRLSY
jgi:hypothetical protein